MDYNATSGEGDTRKHYILLIYKADEVSKSIVKQFLSKSFEGANNGRASFKNGDAEFVEDNSIFSDFLLPEPLKSQIIEKVIDPGIYQFNIIDGTLDFLPLPSDENEIHGFLKRFISKYKVTYFPKMLIGVLGLAVLKWFEII